MSVFHKLYRSVCKMNMELGSFFRILNIRMKYPSLKIDFKSKVRRNCKFVCVDGASCEITNSQFARDVLVVVEKNGRLKISNSSVGPNSVITAYQHIEIKNNCSIAEMVVIRDQDHAFDNSKLISESGYRSAPIVIEENVWIGAKATILKGVTIGKNSVVGAHSLVNKNFEAGSIIGGIPAKTLQRK